MKKPNFDLKRLPFDLPAETYHSIEIAPEVAIAMAEGSEQEVAALEKIVTAWEKDKATNPSFSLRIKRKFGFSGPETKRQRDTSASVRRMTLAHSELLERVAIETGEELKNIQRAVFAAQNEGVTEAYLLPYLKDFLAIQSDLADSEPTTKILTTLVQRTIPDWTDELTTMLHPSIVDELESLMDLEYEGLPAPKKSQP